MQLPASIYRTGDARERASKGYYLHFAEELRRRAGESKVMWVLQSWELNSGLLITLTTSRSSQVMSLASSSLFVFAAD